MRVALDHPFRARPALHPALVAAGAVLVVHVPDRVSGVGEGVPLHAAQRRAHPGYLEPTRKHATADRARPFRLTSHDGRYENISITAMSSPPQVHPDSGSIARFSFVDEAIQ